jgi:adenosylmethionine-8-amino-7-oxononanoate aminotransferase
MEAAIKLARQYFTELPVPEPQRTKFIARKESYHGTTLGALAMGGHVARRALFEPMLTNNVSRISFCNAYRGMLKDETTEQYVERLAKELDDEFQRLGPDTVCAFVAEPIVGAVCLPNFRYSH